MPNWNHIVRQHLAALRLSPEREIEIVEEIALMEAENCSTQIEERTMRRIMTMFALMIISLTLAFGQTSKAREQFSLKMDGLTINFTLEGERIVALKDQIAQTTQGAFDYYLKLFGKAPQQALEEKYTSVPIDIKQGEKWAGEVVGHHIYVEFDPKPDATLPAPYTTAAFIKMRWQHDLAHEIFHLWNAKSFRYSSGKEQWFNEGFTQYYTFKGLKRMGAMDDKAFFLGWQILWETYCMDKGFGSISMREAGFTNKSQHTGLVTGGGMFVAVCLDIAIRKSTENRKSLDDLMRVLFEEFNSTDEMYDMEKLMAIVKRLTGSNEEEFFRKYVDGKERIPISEYLQRAGLAVKTDPSGTKIEIAKKNEMDKLEQAILSGISGIRTSDICNHSSKAVMAANSPSCRIRVRHSVRMAAVSIGKARLACAATYWFPCKWRMAISQPS